MAEIVMCDVAGCDQPALPKVKGNEMALCLKHDQELTEAIKNGPVATVELWARFKGFGSLNDMIDKEIEDMLK